jgi:hypothetical protein
MPIAIRTDSNKATLREAAYRAKLSSLPGPSRPAREKPKLTPALRSVVRAQLQNRFVIESPFVALNLKKDYRIGLAARIYELRATIETPPDALRDLRLVYQGSTPPANSRQAIG